MKLILLFAMLFIPTSPSLYDFKAKSIDGDPVDFSKYKGKKVLIVNVASKCGYTPQYEGLEKLYEKYKDHLVIIGFPANNFLWEEPGTNEQIKTFCTKNYGATFPMMEKVSVRGRKIDALFKWLTTQPNPDFTGTIKWNFEKFLLDENGNLIHRFRSNVKPTDAALTEAIERN